MLLKNEDLPHKFFPSRNHNQILGILQSKKKLAAVAILCQQHLKKKKCTGCDVTCVRVIKTSFKHIT